MNTTHDTHPAAKMPPRNNPLPSAVRIFNCAICDKGYSRQLDYETHLGSYDHNHRQRLADMKKLTASNDPDSSKPKQGLDMRAINVQEASKKMAAGGRFTKLAPGTTTAGRGFKKVGAKANDKKTHDADPVESADKPVVAAALTTQMAPRTSKTRPWLSSMSQNPSPGTSMTSPSRQAAITQIVQGARRTVYGVVSGLPCHELASSTATATFWSLMIPTHSAGANTCSCSALIANNTFSNQGFLWPKIACLQLLTPTW
jgi:hypothetical protein